MTNIKKINDKIRPILKSYQIKKASVFGSFARGEESKKSDLDLLVEFKNDKSLFDMMDLQNKLQDTIGRKVDILTFDSVNPLLKPFIQDQIRVIWKKNH